MKYLAAILLLTILDNGAGSKVTTNITHNR